MRRELIPAMRQNLSLALDPADLDPDVAITRKYGSAEGWEK
jgi:hypothetical protein